MTAIPCIFLEPTEFAQENLRRFCTDSTCTGAHGYHNASVVIGTCTYPMSDYDGEGTPNYDRSDPRWPTQCGCGYTFTEGDHWQYNKLRLYSRDDHVALMTTLSDAPVGSMWFADWYPWAGPDGHCLVVKTPAGDWIVDAPSYAGEEVRGNPWSRTGTPPKVTASPSIHFPGRYHGWLQNGFLVPC